MRTYKQNSGYCAEYLLCCLDWRISANGFSDTVGGLYREGGARHAHGSSGTLTFLFWITSFLVTFGGQAKLR